MSQIPECPICFGHAGEPVLSLKSQPVLIGVLWDDPQSAQNCRKGDIDLAFCPGCGFLWNASFDPALTEYDQRYDNSLHFSPTFQRYTQELVHRLTDSYGLHHKTVVDIGCGKGDFLAMLCEAGPNTGFGFDPAYDGSRVETAAADRITWSNDYYGEDHAALQADLVASRFVFEHIPAPREFLTMIRRSISDPERTVVFFEVPDADLIIRQFSVWDLIYEHCSYFTVESLSRVFADCGFEVLRIEETYARQYLTIDARPGRATIVGPGDGGGDLDRLRVDVSRFRQQQEKRISDWRARLDAWAAEGRKVAAWGAGAKAVGFLNMVHDSDVIARVVDINPHKRGKHLPGTGQRIVSPDELASDPPDVVLVMNPVYRDEISADLAARGLRPDLVPV